MSPAQQAGRPPPRVRFQLPHKSEGIGDWVLFGPEATRGMLSFDTPLLPHCCTWYWLSKATWRNEDSGGRRRRRKAAAAILSNTQLPQFTEMGSRVGIAHTLAANRVRKKLWLLHWAGLRLVAAATALLVDCLLASFYCNELGNRIRWDWFCCHFFIAFCGRRTAGQNLRKFFQICWLCPYGKRLPIGVGFGHYQFASQCMNGIWSTMCRKTS